MDETSINGEPTKSRKVFVDKNIGTVYDRSVFTKQHVTLVVAVSSIGTSIPPLAIFKGKRLISNLIENGPPGIKATVTENGWIDKTTCVMRKVVQEMLL